MTNLVLQKLIRFNNRFSIYKRMRRRLGWTKEMRKWRLL
jgi:hypothetical protein